MEERIGQMASMCNGEHDLRVYFCEEPNDESYFMGVCLRCGLTMELPVKQIEEIFNGR